MGHLQSKLNKKCFKSKIKKKKINKKEKKKFKVQEVEEIEENCQFLNDDSDVEAKKIMQDQLAFNSDIFVLNQMMLSVQLFGNLER